MTAMNFCKSVAEVAVQVAVPVAVITEEKSVNTRLSRHLVAEVAEFSTSRRFSEKFVGSEQWIQGLYKTVGKLILLLHLLPKRRKPLKTLGFYGKVLLPELLPILLPTATKKGGGDDCGHEHQRSEACAGRQLQNTSD